MKRRPSLARALALKCAHVFVEQLCLAGRDVLKHVLDARQKAREAAALEAEDTAEGEGDTTPDATE